MTAIDVPTAFTGFEDDWQPFPGGQGPAPPCVASLDERLPASEDGSISLTARAWAVRGGRGPSR